MLRTTPLGADWAPDTSLTNVRKKFNKNFTLITHPQFTEPENRESTSVCLLKAKYCKAGYVHSTSRRWTRPIPSSCTNLQFVCHLKKSTKHHFSKYRIATSFRRHLWLHAVLLMGPVNADRLFIQGNFINRHIIFVVHQRLTYYFGRCGLPPIQVSIYLEPSW